MVRLQLDPFLNEVTNMFERTTETGSVWVTLKHSSDKSKVKLNKMKTAGEKIEYKCLIRATDGKKTIATMVGPKDHQRFQSSYATILKARMTALKKRERKDRKKAMDSEKKPDSKKPSAANPLVKQDSLVHSIFCVATILFYAGVLHLVFRRLYLI